MLKIGDKVKVIEENLSYKENNEYATIKDFIGKNEDNFVVTYLWENDEFPIEISKQNGEKLGFSESELEKVED